METTGKFYWCCDCIHYLHGRDEQPCAKGHPYVGYLATGCHRWQNKEGERKPVITHKVCSVCGRNLPVKHFSRQRGTQDYLSKRCRDCHPQCKKEKQ